MLQRSPIMLLSAIAIASLWLGNFLVSAAPSPIRDRILNRRDTPSEAGNTGAYMCTAKTWGQPYDANGNPTVGDCKWVPIFDTGCNSLVNTVYDQTISSFGPDKGLKCVLYETPDCSMKWPIPQPDNPSTTLPPSNSPHTVTSFITVIPSTSKWPIPLPNSSSTILSSSNTPLTVTSFITVSPSVSQWPTPILDNTSTTNTPLTVTSFITVLPTISTSVNATVTTMPTHVRTAPIVTLTITVSPTTIPIWLNHSSTEVHTNWPTSIQTGTAPVGVASVPSNQPAPEFMDIWWPGYANMGWNGWEDRVRSFSCGFE